MRISVVLRRLVLVAVGLAALAHPAWAGPADACPRATAAREADVRRAAGRNRWYDCCRRPCWDFEVAVPIWIPGVTGSLASGSVAVDAKDSVGDAIGEGLGDLVSELFEGTTDLRFAFVGSVVVRHRRWRLVVDGFGARLGHGVTFTLTDDTVVEGEIGALILRARLAYEIDRRAFCLFGYRACFTGAAYVGARYYHAGFEADLPLGVRVDRTENWWDPLVGVDLELQWRRWGLRANTDVGGGIGSDLSVWVSGELEYRFNAWLSILAGYALLDVDYEEGSGPGRFAWNVQLSGPVLGLRFRF